MSGPSPPGNGVDEFDLIARLLRPLTNGAPEALGLLDDAAILPGPDGTDLVVSADMIVRGVHFLPEDPMDLVARKLLRVNLSDLAAKGADPYAYFLTVAWPSDCGWTEREAFAAGLRRDQDAYGLVLLGGDTTSTPGPLTLSATVLGKVASGAAVLRSGAALGDVVLVSGAIGDGWLGLKAAKGEDLGLGDEAAANMAERYRLPQPRNVLAALLRQGASAAADVSDGLVADAGRIAIASGVAIELDLASVPLSPEGLRYISAQPDPASARLALATGGDDYELVLTVRKAQAGDLITSAAHLGVAMTRVGRVVEGEGVRVLWAGEQIRVDHAGYRHR